MRVLHRHCGCGGAGVSETPDGDVPHDEVSRPTRSRLMEHIGDTTQFSTLDQQTDPRFFIQYLDAGNALADVKRLKQVMMAQLELGSGLHLLDVGCGTGDDVRAL